MAEQVGAKIKEARTAAGMTQKELAKAVDGVSADSLSKAERGLKELTDEQLVAIAEATGADPELFGVAKEEVPAAPAVEENEAPAIDDEGILKLLSKADPAVKEAALSVLKGDTPQSKGFLSDLLPMVAELVGADKGGNPLVAIIGFLASEEGTAFLGTLKGIVENITDVFGISDTADGGQKGSKTIPTSFLAFTFFYTVAIYILLIGFHLWQVHQENKLGE